MDPKKDQIRVFQANHLSGKSVATSWIGCRRAPVILGRNAMTDLTLRPVRADDHPRWDELYTGYCDFYRVPTTVEKRRRVFEWLLDETQVLEGVVAEREGVVIALAHYREMPRPLHGAMMGFLDDLFVDPAARGGKVGEAIFAHLEEICRARGWSVMRWLTQDHNYRARTLYDRIGAKTALNLYEMTVR
jgi:GNAT superfamily N-acetyltransferase